MKKLLFGSMVVATALTTLCIAKKKNFKVLSK